MGEFPACFCESCSFSYWKLLRKHFLTLLKSGMLCTNLRNVHMSLSSGACGSSVSPHGAEQDAPKPQHCISQGTAQVCGSGSLFCSGAQELGAFRAELKLFQKPVKLLASHYECGLLRRIKEQTQRMPLPVSLSRKHRRWCWSRWWHCPESAEDWKNAMPGAASRDSASLHLLIKALYKIALNWVLLLASPLCHPAQGRCCSQGTGFGDQAEENKSPETSAPAGTWARDVHDSRYNSAVIIFFIWSYVLHSSSFTNKWINKIKP